MSATAAKAQLCRFALSPRDIIRHRLKKFLPSTFCGPLSVHTSHHTIFFLIDSKTITKKMLELSCRPFYMRLILHCGLREKCFLVQMGFRLQYLDRPLENNRHTAVLPVQPVLNPSMACRSSPSEQMHTMKASSSMCKTKL